MQIRCSQRDNSVPRARRIFKIIAFILPALSPPPRQVSANAKTIPGASVEERLFRAQRSRLLNKFGSIFSQITFRLKIVHVSSRARKKRKQENSTKILILVNFVALQFSEFQN